MVLVIWQVVVATRCNDSASDGLLRRKKQQTASEVKRVCRTWHRCKNARLECTARSHAVVHSSFHFFVYGHLRTAAATPAAFLLADRRTHAWYIQFMAWWHCYCAFPLSLVVQLSLLPRKPSNVRGCGIFMMYRLPARLSLIVVRRMSFVEQYFLVLRAAEAWFDASTWPGHGLHVRRAEDEQGTQQKRR